MALVRIRNAGTGRRKEPVVAKKVLNKVVATHVENYEILRYKCKEQVATQHNINAMQQHNFQIIEKKLVKRTYLVGVVTYLIGTLSGGGFMWLMN